ncbi:thioredoxin-like protein [Dendryphion nanum]|uniref:Large ribosomal subunit protein mL43 n=1 Tax=Dendryphion nanum TaxID=256645 RepID=A0A9P9D6Y2_9PLEO|nr:thioredoxin-like protein [Dendryphion nanum]
MPLSAIKTVAKAQNGVGAFILQCKKLDFHYCDWAGSSRGMNSFLKTYLERFARRNPQIEISISPRPGRHPVVIGHYINGRSKAICVRRMSPEQVREKVELLRDTNGEKLKRVTKPVTSLNESVRGIWSPFHGSKIQI